MFVSPLCSSLLFTGKAGAYPSRASYGTLLKRLAPSLAPKHLTRVEVTDIGKRSSVLLYDKNYCRTIFYSTGSWGQCYKTFFVRNLRIFVISPLTA